MSRISARRFAAYLLALAVLLGGTLPAAAAPLATSMVMDATQAPPWIRNPEACLVRDTPMGPVVATRLNDDPYTAPFMEILLPDLPAGEAGVVVEIEHLDEGAGVIGVSIDGSGPARQSGYTRLNTGVLRQAWFGFTKRPGAGAVLRLQGAPWLHAVRVLPAQSEAAWQAQNAAVPVDVAPMVQLRRPLSLTTTAGIDVQGGMDTLDASLVALRELAPLARVLGFTSIESYVTWKRLEPNAEGAFDFGYYDTIVAALEKYNLKWFPLLIVGSAYALPEWFLKSDENIGMVCLEHGLSNPIQSIAAPSHRRHVTRVLQAFGAHYEPMGVLEGVRLGPSGNYGESQYPAGGNWGVAGQPLHIHIGWWAGDAPAVANYKAYLQQRYTTVDALNAAWKTTPVSGFDAVPMSLPDTMYSLQQRLDFTDWYTGLMSDWCAWWAAEARRAMPHTPLYQSAGGWGFREAGTDYSAQTKAMAAVQGGIRLTNETDSFEQNYYATRLAATAARHYGVPIGYEPASSHTARGVVGRLYEATTTNAAHWFTYHSNVFNHPLAIQKWLDNLAWLDERQPSIVDVAVYYPETMNQVDDGAFRHLYAWGFNPVAAAVRRVVECDYVDERLIRDGALDEYKVLVCAWGNLVEADVQARIDGWLRAGGTLIYPSFPRGPQKTTEGDTAVFARWQTGDTGQGRFFRFPGDMEPPSLYGAFIRKALATQPGLHAATRAALQVEHPEQVFVSAQADGHLLLLNYEDVPATVRLPGQFETVLPAYSMAREALEKDTP